MILPIIASSWCISILLLSCFIVFLLDNSDEFIEKLEHYNISIGNIMILEFLPIINIFILFYLIGFLISEYIKYCKLRNKERNMNDTRYIENNLKKNKSYYYIYENGSSYRYGS